MEDQLEKLRQQFQALPPEQHIKAWDDAWNGNLTPWDRGQSNPALVETLKEKTDLSGSPFKDENGKNVRKKVLVPGELRKSFSIEESLRGNRCRIIGCGRGYDVLLFASYGFDAYGLDSSPTAVEGARKLFHEQGKEQQYPVQNIQNGRGNVQFIVADFFKDGFLAQTHATEPGNTFDISP